MTSMKMSDDSKRVTPGHKLSDFKAQVAYLANQGNKSEEWKEYIDSVKSRINLLEESKQKAMFEILYSTAFKAIPDTSKTPAYANLLVDYADFKSKYSLVDAEKLILYCQRKLGSFAIVHVASAELELKKGDKEKAIRILHRAERSGLEQGDIINIALQRIHDGKSSLLRDITNDNRFSSKTSPTNGKEISEDLNMSQFSGYLGERDLLKLSLTGSRSNTQEMQQGFKNFSSHQDEHLMPENKLPLSSAKEKYSPPKDENQDPENYSGASSHLASRNAQSTSPPTVKTADSPKQASEFSQKKLWSANRKSQLSNDDSLSGLSLESSNNGSKPWLTTLLKIPETPDMKLKQPSPAKKQSLQHFHSTPVLSFRAGSYGSSMKKSLRILRPKNPQPPPRRVKVDPALKAQWEDDDEDVKSDFTLSDFPLLAKDSNAYNSTGESKTSESSEIHTEPQDFQEIRSLLNNQLTGESLYSKHDLSSHDLNTSQLSFPKKTDLSSYKVNFPQGKKFQMGRQRHSSTTETLKERLKGDGDSKNMSHSLLTPQFVQKHLPSQKAQPADKVLTDSGDPSFIASGLESFGFPQSVENRQKIFQESKERDLISSSKPNPISLDCHAKQPDVLKNVDTNSNKGNFLQESKAQMMRDNHQENSMKRPEARDKYDWKPKTDSSGVSSIDSQPSTVVQRFATGQKVELPSMGPPESSVAPKVEGSDVGRSAHSIDLKQKLFQEQQNLVKQQVLEQQQQQMRQHVAVNPTYSVHSQIPSAAQIAYVTPAKQGLGGDQKSLYVNGLPYSVIRKVGRGGSAKVYQVFDPNTNKICALKVVNLSCANAVVLEGFKNEIALLKKLQHCDRVIKLFDSEYRESSQKLFLVLEYGEIDLDNFIAQNVTSEKQLSPSTIFYFWLQMVTAVHAMHREGVIHSDLKPPNFILVSGVVKLIDFGIANSIQQDSTSVLKDIKMGTPSYMSPEMLVANTASSMDKPRYKVGKRSDVWSLGCILYQMVYGRTPFQNVPDKIHAIINPHHPIDFPHRDDPALMDVLKKCLQRDVTLRPTTEELLKHPYLQIKNAVSTNTTSNLPPTLESKLSLLETVLSSSSPRTKKALEHKFKEFYSSA